MSLGGSLPTTEAVAGAVLNPLTGAIYAAYDSSDDALYTAQMFLPGAGPATPTSVGTFELPSGGNFYGTLPGGIALSAQCNILAIVTAINTPGYVNYFSMGDGTALPTNTSTIQLGTDQTTYARAGTFEYVARRFKKKRRTGQGHEFTRG